MQLLNVRKSSRRNKNVRPIIILVVIVLVVVGVFSVKPALKKYRAWKQDRALAQAEQFLEQNDLPKAKLALDVAFAAVPGNPDALRIAARLLEQAGSPEVLPLRRRLVRLDPNSVEDRAALITAAIRWKDLNAARDAMREMSPEQANQPIALKAALAYAMATGNRPIADALYDRLREEEPDNENLKVMHAVLRLQNPNEGVVAKARRELDELAKNPRNTLFIQRELLFNAIASSDFKESLKISETIIQNPQATLTDRLHRANLAINHEERPFAEVFAELTAYADENETQAVELIRWALALGQPVVVENWIASLSDELRSSPELKSLEADAVAMLQDWDRMGGLLEAGVWGDIKQDTVRLALSTRIEATRDNAPLQNQLWDEALSSAGNSLAELRILHRLASLWQEEDFSEKTLWVITRGFRGQTWAHETLFTVYRRNQDTANLRALMNVLRERDSTLPRYKYDWALLSLLTQKSSGWSPAKTAMNELYVLDSKNPSYVTGYALALAQSEKVDQALELIDAMAPEDRNAAARAPYLAYIYGVGRRGEDYKRVALLEPQLQQLLPEEKFLFELGEQMLNRPLPKKKDVSAMKAKAAQETTSDDSVTGEE